MRNRRLPVISNVVVLIGSFAVSGDSAWSQTMPLGRAVPPSTPVAYHLFFGHVVFLDEKAGEVERTGRSGAGFRNHYKSSLRLLDVDHAALVRRAKACEKEIADHDAKASKVIAEIRSRIPKGKSPADVPVPREIFQLQADRTGILDKHLAGLQSDLKPDSFRRVDAFVRGDFARQASVRTIINEPHQRFSASKTAERARSTVK